MHRVAELQQMAQLARQQARLITDDGARRVLLQIASQYELKATERLASMPEAQPGRSSMTN